MTLLDPLLHALHLPGHVWETQVPVHGLHVAHGVRVNSAVSACAFYTSTLQPKSQIRTRVCVSKTQRHAKTPVWSSIVVRSTFVWGLLRARFPCGHKLKNTCVAIRCCALLCSKCANTPGLPLGTLQKKREGKRFRWRLHSRNRGFKAGRVRFQSETKATRKGKCKLDSRNPLQPAGPASQ